MAGSRRTLMNRRADQGVGVTQQRIESFADYLRSECRLSQHTVDAYQRDLALFETWLAGRKVNLLKLRDLSDFVAFLRDRRLAPSSTARHIVSLRMFFRYLQLEGVLTDNLAELIEELFRHDPLGLSVTF